MTEPLFTDTRQIAIVVPDLDAAMRTYVEEYGIGPWQIFEYNPTVGESMIVDDEPVEYAMRVAVTQVGRLEWELIEPLDDKSIYATFLAIHGPGLHHVKVTVGGGYHGALRDLRQKGHTIRQGGQYKGYTFAYMSTDQDLNVIAEIVDEPPGFEHPPDAIYPPPAERPAN